MKKNSLQEDFALFKNEITIRLDYLTREVKDMREGIVSRVVDLESRVRILENDSNVAKGDSKGISNAWKIVVVILTLIIGGLTYFATIR